MQTLLRLQRSLEAAPWNRAVLAEWQERFGQDFAPGASELLNYLIAQAAIPEYQVRWRWQKNSVAIWDNRCTQHYAVMDYWPAVRKMERAGIIGDVPF